MRNLILTCLMLFSSIIYAQEFYDLNTIQTIEITFAESNWDQLLDNAYPSGEYIMAEIVTINGEVFDSVGVKYKGNSTYQSNQTKNPFHIELDTYKDHKYEAYTDIKLSNVAKDPSFLREVLSYQVIRQYMVAPLSNYANVYVNGNLIGLYSNSEAISKKFVNSRFFSKNNTFVKCNPPEGAGPQSNDFPNLVYMGQDSTDYYDAYEIKSDDGWDELIDLCDTLSNHTDVVEQILDVDKALWMLALNNVLVNLDSYIGMFAQNYYLYRDDYGRFLPVIWDLNESFGRFSGAGGSGGNLNSTTAKQQMSPFLHENDADFPLVQKLLDVPMYRKMYLAHY
ncbi:MAG: CotH kinase family protein, partial [Chitinophagales bacterium]